MVYLTKLIFHYSNKVPNTGKFVGPAQEFSSYYVTVLLRKKSLSQEQADELQSEIDSI